MKKLLLACGAQVLLDDDDYEKIPKTGWYLTDKYHGVTNRKTRYVFHDKLGRMHRYILNLTDPMKLVDHLDGNGLNNQKQNLRIVTSSVNKKNQKTVSSNKFNFNGISFQRNGNYLRILVKWSQGIPQYKYGGYRCRQRSKSFSINKFGSLEQALKQAILFRIEKMRENDYFLDERSTTIERLIYEGEKTIQQILEITLSQIIKQSRE